MKPAALLINIGSPDSLDIKDVKSYLTKFLMDPRVIDYPYWLRHILIKMIIIPRRAPNSKEAYEQVWTEEGSPLLVYTRQLIEKLNQTSEQYDWFWAMRYSKPSIEEQLRKIIASGYKEIVLFPAYPQFADSATSSSIDEVKEALKRIGKQNTMDLKISYVQDFYKNPAFINEVVTHAQGHLGQQKFDHYVFSFHGLPESHLRMIHPSCVQSQCSEQIGPENAKCYRAQCYQTAQAVASGLGIQSENYTVAFQSRLGPSKWIEPYTDVVVEDMAQSLKVKSLAVFSLSFVTDCLETLEELDIRLKESFIKNGGEQFFRVPCLNSDFKSAPEILRSEALMPLELHHR